MLRISIFNHGQPTSVFDERIDNLAKILILAQNLGDGKANRVLSPILYLLICQALLKVPSNSQFLQILE